MKIRFIIYSILVFATFNSLSSQPFIRGTVESVGNDVLIKVRPTATISHVTGSVVAFNVTISIDSEGMPLSSAPVPVSVSTPISGAIINTLATSMIHGRFVYTFTFIGNTTIPINWPAGVEQNLMLLDFPAVSFLNGKFPRLEDQTNDDGGSNAQMYFYADFNGIDYTDYSNLFYANPGATLGLDPNGDQYVQAATPLPLNLIKFSASKHESRSVLLEWSTSNEINSSHIDIYRSHDEDRWMYIGRVAAAGNSTTELNYNFIDDQLPLNRSKNQIFYYKLKLVDQDGSYKFSDIRGVNFTLNDRGTVSLYPNPASAFVNIDMSDLDFTIHESAQLSIYDMSGRLMMQKDIIGSGIEPVMIAQLPAETYNVVIRHGEQMYSRRLVVTK